MNPLSDGNGATSTPILRLEGVSFRYRGSRSRIHTLDDIHLEIRRGETVVLMGPNGSGKTTLLRLAAGLVRPGQGRVVIRLNGHDESLRAPLKEIGYIPQQLGLLRSRTVQQNVLLGCLGRVPSLHAWAGTFPEEEMRTASEWIRRVGLRHKEQEKVQYLSGGERQRVAIARTLMQRPRILLADEFVSNLDAPKARETLRFARERLGEEHVSTLLALHNVDLARQFADRIIFLKDGRIAADLPAAEVSPEVAEWHLAS